MANTRKVISLLTVTGIVAGCSGLEFRTNIGPYTESRLVSAAVEIYSPTEISRYDAVTLGNVEATACQERPDEPVASRAELVRQMKMRAHRLGGNGLVIEACGKTTLGVCQTYIECHGTAYSVPQRQTRP
ncbi:hypothetical protein [Microbulbifer yueqingensis]|uniref:RcsF protein n=1 Tax=Microbulbifer yueqingensis TaxID=658219 RepID=A0A1G9AAP9_9GAMM|nr:hypothetical protein [Microbulbifer yueqingensis]SDK23530.1 hypothetical protein SAMN05216212_1890 [Microbulbifer yueqingensis]